MSTPFRPTPRPSYKESKLDEIAHNEDKEELDEDNSSQYSENDNDRYSEDIVDEENEIEHEANDANVNVDKRNGKLTENTSFENGSSRKRIIVNGNNSKVDSIKTTDKLIVPHEKSDGTLSVILIGGILVAVLIAVAIAFIPQNNVRIIEKKVECDDKYPMHNSNSDVWLSLKCGIDRVINEHKPSKFIFLYKDLSEDYIDSVIKSLSEYASCYLNTKTTPIELSKSELTSSRAKNNYGYIIEKYQDVLNEKKVMIVKHLEQIPGQVAQVFHVFCDEVTPLVEESLFIFTMQVDNFEDGVSDSKLVTSILRENWPELHEDIFEPLITRLSSMILRIE